MDELLQIFFAEAEELTEALYNDIRALRDPQTEGHERRELLARIFRHTHTLKGSSAALSFNEISQLAHEFESLLDAARMGRIEIDETALDCFEQAAHALDGALARVARGEPVPSASDLIESLRRLTMPRPTIDAILAALPSEIASTLTDYERHRIREAAKEGSRFYLINVEFELASFDEKFRQLRDALSECGEVISTLPSAEASATDKVRFLILYASERSRDALEQIGSSFAINLDELSLHTPPKEAPESERAVTESVDSAAKPERGAAEIVSPSAMVRVPLDELDEIVFALHELFTDTVSALNLSGARIEAELLQPRIHRRFLELEERLVELRMIPIAQTLERTARAARATARAANKDIEIEIGGGDVRLDKSLADRISDPLLHLVRNAVDHGIETPEERRRANKSERGKISIEAVSEGSRILVRISDDGRGIDPERVRRVAVERGLIAEDAPLTEQQILRLIFRPGFSTAATVSEVSGRGVGLDVVERTVEQMGGELRLSSHIGRGTTFELVLPTTLTLMPSLIVRSLDQRYCIPANHIIEAGFIKKSEIEKIGTVETIRWRGALLPFVHLRTLLAQPPDKSKRADERLPVIISRIHQGHRFESNGPMQTLRVAVAVDSWEGHSEVLVRGLGRHAAHWRGISGATELPDGTLALILDLPRLLEMNL